GAGRRQVTVDEPENVGGTVVAVDDGLHDPSLEPGRAGFPGVAWRFVRVSGVWCGDGPVRVGSGQPMGTSWERDSLDRATQQRDGLAAAVRQTLELRRAVADPENGAGGERAVAVVMTLFSSVGVGVRKSVYSSSAW
ncbi:hypothetical protein ACWEKM_45395, partial [Streptomyces sp. NPDC004752]